jgi:hypothetical protein
LESERAEHTLDGLAPAPGIARFAATGARGSWAHPIRGISVEELLDDSSRQSQDLLPNCEFERLQIQIFHGLATHRTSISRTMSVASRPATAFFFNAGLFLPLGRLQLRIRPLFAGDPVRLQLTPKLMPGFDLLAHDASLLGGDEPGAGLAAHDSCQAVVRTVASLGILGAATAWLAALYIALGEGAAAHGLGFGEASCQLADRSGEFKWLGHKAAFLRL